MALYQFRCADSHISDHFYQIASAPITLNCPACGKPADRIISPSTIVVKGFNAANGYSKDK